MNKITMKKFFLFSLVVLALVACKKNEPDVREAFVGTYNLKVNCVFRASSGNETVDNLLPDSIPYEFSDEMTITKDDGDETKVIVKSKVYNCAGLVSGNHLMLESENNPDFRIDLGEVTGVSMLQGVTLPLNYSLVHKTADLNNNVLTWHSDATGSGSVSILTYSLTFSGSGKLDNTATKK